MLGLVTAIPEEVGFERQYALGMYSTVQVPWKISLVLTL